MYVIAFFDSFNARCDHDSLGDCGFVISVMSLMALMSVVFMKIFNSVSSICLLMQAILFAPGKATQTPPFTVLPLFPKARIRYSQSEYDMKLQIFTYLANTQHF